MRLSWGAGASVLVGLFVVGGLIGWLITDSKDHPPGTAPHSARRPPGHLERRIKKLESEVESARSQTRNAGEAAGVAPPPSSVSASSAPAPSSTSGRPLAGVTVVVDPGHNGGNAAHPEEIDRPVVSAADGTTKPCNTTGTETNDGNLTEAAFNFDVALALRGDLRSLGAKVVMTRQNNGGIGPCVNERAEIANRAGAAAAISIHADGNEAESAHGFDVIHASPEQMVEPSLARPSTFMAEDVRDALVGAGLPPANYVGKRGLDERSDLGGLNLARVPAVLVELGNMRSAEEAEKLESQDYRARLAKALLVGLTRFLEEAQA